MARRLPRAPRRWQRSGTATAAGPAGGTRRPPSVAARQSDCRRGGPTRSCPCATALPAAVHDRPHGVLAGRHASGPRAALSAPAILGVNPWMGDETNWPRFGPAEPLGRGCGPGGRCSPPAGPRSPSAAGRSPGGNAPAPPAEEEGQGTESSPLARLPAAASSRSCRGRGCSPSRLVGQARPEASPGGSERLPKKTRQRGAATMQQLILACPSRKASSVELPASA